MQKSFDFLVFIGRFQPFHNGHLEVIEKALSLSKYLIVLCGSAHQPATFRNPWSFHEREKMILASLPQTLRKNVITAPLEDFPYNDNLWVQQVQNSVDRCVSYYWLESRKPTIGLVGLQGSGSGFYRNRFPQWGSVAVDETAEVSGADIRDALFGLDDRFNSGAEYLESASATGSVPESVLHQLHGFVSEEAFKNVREELQFVQDFQRAWKVAPYQPTFNTVDAIVVQSGHILLVERKNRPGKGLWALPGGFVDQHEFLVDACIRELQEETQIALPESTLKASIQGSKVFDDPYRSARGRTFTYAFYLQLTASDQLPDVEAADDAKQAMWVPLAEINSEQMFEDHYFVIQEMLGYSVC